MRTIWHISLLFAMTFSSYTLSNTNIDNKTHNKASYWRPRGISAFALGAIMETARTEALFAARKGL